MCNNCNNLVFTPEGNKTCGEKKEDGTQYFCYPCLEGMINGAHTAVESLALALFFVREEYKTKGELCDDTLKGIGETLDELNFTPPIIEERQVYPH